MTDLIDDDDDDADDDDDDDDDNDMDDNDGDIDDDDDGDGDDDDVAAMAAGCATPVNTIVLGSVVDIFIDNMQVANSTNQTYGDLILEEIKPVTLYFVYIGVGSLVSSYLAVSLWTLAGERQITRIRKLFFRGVMRQDIGWFDTHEVGELNSRFSDDMHKISEGMCDKMPVFIQWLIRSMAVKEFQAYAKAGAVAEQTLRAIRTVQAFQDCYEDNLVSATKVASKKGLVFGLGTSFFWVIIFCAFAVAFYYGVVLIQTEGFSPGNILVVLNGLSLTVNPGQHVALVGASGCGKSTAIQLLQRFYDPEQGQVTVDGHDVRDLNLKWLRDQIGVVSQEPVLFAATIAENIRYGRDGVTQSEIETAAKEANAHDFVVQLPQGYDTLIGERGAQLSGGQKQRIAIARALVRNPRILLLDEATSALDHESEAVVQAALEKAEVGRTTIVIAHRLSTIRYADSIVSLSHGQKEEEGTHDELIARDGLYAQLVKLQTNAESETGEDIGFLQIVEDDDDDEIADDDHLLKKVFLRSLSAGSGRSRSLSIRSSTRGKKGKDKDKDKGDNKKEDKDSTKEETPVQEASVKRLLRLNSPEWLQILVGTVFSAFCGLSHPSFAFIMSEFIGVFSLTDKDEQTEKAIMLALIMVAIGIAVSIMRLTLSVCFAKSGSALTARLRSMAFKAVLKQDMSFFDSAENQVGTLTTRLANDAALVQGATGSKIGSLLEAVSTMAASLTIAFANYTGQVGVRSVVFHYPTRPTVPVLNELTVAVEPGQTLALVGGSGCGKSTVLQLLQRFYDPDAGAMTIDGRDLRQMDLRWFRQQLGIVSQEPTLFDGSIASNIAYGDNTREVPMADIIAAARAANIHSFIDSLPQGYDTSVGDKGTQLSGGQKQRIAIARALIRRPKVLLLDEATSALDTESERVVQEALDKAREGRTCIVIAHRLTTIQNADRIAVINHGRVQEIGTHSQLVTRQGAYYRLLQTQNHSRLD
nr:hypothetical protein BaRGS_017671 [Batillaria attramentaria]